MAIPDVVREEAEALLQDLKAQMDLIQSQVLASSGRYWQGAITHNPIPMDGNETPPNLSAKPTNELKGWADRGVQLPNAMVLATEVHVHQSSEGSGYTVIGTIQIGQKLWRKCLGTGSGAMNHDWQELE